MIEPVWDNTPAPKTRTKPGETTTRRILAREQKAKQTLKALAEQRKTVRDKVTGRTKAQSYVRLWLKNLTATELRHECEMRGFRYGDFDEMEQAIDTICVAMFMVTVAEEHHEEACPVAAGTEPE